MRRPLTPRENRIAALAVLAACVCLMYWGALYPWLIAPQLAVRQQMDELRDTQRRYVALLARREPLQAQLAAAQADPAGVDALLPGDDPSAIAAGLMQYTADLVGRHASDGAGCEVLNRTPSAAEPGDERYAQVKVTLNLSCSIEPLEAILYDIETARPYLFVTQLRVEHHADSPIGAGAGRLQVQLLVTGYRHRSTGEGS
ncbi:type II secretion system protein GspM [Pseudomonas sp. TE3610]